jgi:hypothetical protein
VLLPVGVLALVLGVGRARAECGVGCLQGARDLLIISLLGLVVDICLAAGSSLALYRGLSTRAAARIRSLSLRLIPPFLVASAVFTLFEPALNP